MKKTGKCLSLLLALCLLLSLLPVTAQAEWSGEGDGTSETPYKIGTAAELKKFRDIVNGLNGETKNTAACAVLTADIDLNNEAWTPIGNTTSKYTGIFDGNGKTISGLFINDPDGSFQGLFGYVDAAGKVREVGVVSGSVTGKSFVGSVVGWNYGTVENCYNTGSVSASDYSDAATPKVGGVVGRNFHATVNLCYNTGNITSTGFNAAAGGVVGQSTSSGKVQNCYNTGNVNGTGANYSIGGVVGESAISTISDCYNVGSVSASSSSVSTLLIDAAGGVAGYIEESIIQNCYNTGDVSGTSVGSPARIGGVVGRFSSATLTDCYYLAGTASTGIGDNNATATELEGSQLTDKTSFAGFDFSNNWYMGANGPELWAFASHVSTWAALAAALNEGGGIVLDADVKASSNDTALFVPTGITATLDLNGHTVDRGYGNQTEPGFGGSVLIINGTLTLMDSDPTAGGAITGGFNDQYGGGVQIQGGTFNMQGGSITGNSAGKNGFFGTEGLGGGVYLQSGTFNMSGGTITGNKALGSALGSSLGRGGGVYITGGTFNFTGGTISGNDAGAIGGGVYLASTYSGHDGKLSVSGKAAVKYNTVGDADSNVYLEEGGVLTVTDTLTGTLGVTMQTPGVFTSGLSGNGAEANFISDNAAYGVALSGTEATLLPCEATPEAVFTATGPDTGTLSNVAAGMTYAIDSGAAVKITGDSVDLTGLAPCTIKVIQPGNGTTTLDSEAQTITVTKAAAPDGVSAEGCTTVNNNDGKLVGVTAAMEYKLSNAEAWTCGTDGGVTDLAPGDYLVRVAASGTVLASDTNDLTVGEYVAPSSGGGSSRYAIILPAEVEHAEVTVSPQSAARGAVVTITVTPDEGYKVDSVAVTDSRGNEVPVTDNGDGTYSFKMPASKVTVTPVVVEIEDEPVPLANRPFVDVPEGSWFYDAVYHCFDNGYFQGVDGTHFDPQGTMTRAMFATVLYRMAGEPEVTGENPFTDVDADTWYTNAVIWAAGEGIIGGYGNGIFGTNDPVTREQMVTIIWRYNGRPNPENADFSGFIDADAISAWAQDAFAWAVETGVISGKGDGVLDPKGTATRAEVAQIVMNYDTLV